MGDGNNTSRATAATVGLAVGVITVWVFTTVTGVVPPAEVSTAWGTLTMAIVGAIYSRLGA